MLDPLILKIGNVIETSSGIREIADIKESEGEVFVYWDEGSCTSKVTHGIVLFPQLLESIGFKMVRQGYYTHGTYDSFPESKSDGTSLAFESAGKAYHLKFVHDLQNVFREFTGEDLKVNPILVFETIVNRGR